VIDHCPKSPEATDAALSPGRAMGFGAQSAEAEPSAFFVPIRRGIGAPRQSTRQGS
jgi:hypothetical protein